MAVTKASNVRLGAASLVMLTLAIVVVRLWTVGETFPRDLTGQQVDALKIEIGQDGFYRITLDQLRAANLGVDHLGVGSLDLTLNDQSIPYLLGDDGLIFYGRGSSSRYTPVRSYVLRTERGGLQMEQVAASERSGAAVSRLPQKLHLEENHIYDGRARPADASEVDSFEPWYWATVQVANQVTIEFDVPSKPLGRSTVRLGLWGATYDDRVQDDHDVEIQLNHVSLGNLEWDGQVHFAGELQVREGLLRSGSNSLVIDNPASGAAAVDVMRLDWIEVIYNADLQVIEDRTALSGVEGRVELTGFSSRPRFFEISDPDAPKELTDWRYSSGTVELDVLKNEQVVGVGPHGYLVPDGILPLGKGFWRDSSRQADLIVVTTDELVRALEPLVQARRNQGLGVAVVPVDDIYDEFGYGQAGPQSIAAFIRHAASNWTEPKARYVLLVGDATYDYRGYLRDPERSLIPSPMVPVNYSGETTSDSRLADTDGDLMPDLAIGRWPVDSSTEVASLVERTLAYEQGAPQNTAIFAADGSSPEFAILSDNLIGSSGFGTDNIRRLYGARATDIVGAWNQGAWLVSYAGHGSLDRWGKDDVFSTSWVGSLASRGTPPVVVQLTCLTGFFAHPERDSLAESMLLHENGPVLIVAATSLTLSSSQEPFGASLLRELGNPANLRIGDALQRAKLTLDVAGNEALREVSDTFGLLGDPSAQIVRPTGVAILSPALAVDSP